jgi:hypothetical protein
MTDRVRGEAATEEAARAREILFGGGLDGLGDGRAKRLPLRSRREERGQGAVRAIGRTSTPVESRLG